MKKVFLFACVALMAAMVVSCGKKKLEGETIDTKYFSLIMPQGWTKGGSTNPAMGCMIMKDGEVGKQVTMGFHATEYNKNMKMHDPAEMMQWNVEKKGAVDKGEQEFNGHKYYAYYEENLEKLTLLTQLADSAVLRIEIKRADLENEEVKTILDNVTIKEAASMPEGAAADTQQEEVPIDQQTELSGDAYTIKVPADWKARSRMVNNSCVLGLKQPPFTTASPDVVSYENLDQYKAKREKEGSKAIESITVGGREFVVYENEGKNDQLFLGAATAYDKGTFQLTLSTGAHKLSKDEAKAAIKANLKTILENISFK